MLLMYILTHKLHFANRYFQKIHKFTLPYVFESPLKSPQPIPVNTSHIRQTRMGSMGTCEP